MTLHFKMQQPAVRKPPCQLSRWRMVSALPVVLVTLLMMPAGTVSAQDPQEQNTFLPENQRQASPRIENPRIDRRAASELARKNYPGRVLSILEDKDKGEWRVRMDQDGKVFNVFVNMYTGKVSRESD